jgi:hypothetical protein
MPTHIKVQELNIAHSTLLKDQQVELFNLGITKNLQMVKLNAAFVKPIATNSEALFQEYKDIFAWN